MSFAHKPGSECVPLMLAHQQQMGALVVLGCCGVGTGWDQRWPCHQDKTLLMALVQQLPCEAWSVCSLLPDCELNRAEPT